MVEISKLTLYWVGQNKRRHAIEIIPLEQTTERIKLQVGKELTKVFKRDWKHYYVVAEIDSAKGKLYRTIIPKVENTNA